MNMSVRLGALVLAGAALAGTPSQAGEHLHGRTSLHGGVSTATKAHYFETVFAPDGIRVYRYSSTYGPQMVEKAIGTASVRFADRREDVELHSVAPAEGEAAVYFCPMHSNVVRSEPGVCEQCGGMKLFRQDYLFGKVDLSTDSQMNSLVAVKVRISKLGNPDEPEHEATFTVKPASVEQGPPVEAADGGTAAHHHH